MTALTSTNLFWDTCVLTRFLTSTPIDHVADIAKFIDEAKAGKYAIYMSTMVIAEVRPWQLQKRGYNNFQGLIDDMEAAINLIGPTPPILMRAARLRNYAYHRTPKQAAEKERVMSGMDAVHIATCLHVKYDRGVSDLVFHTFDDGKGKNYEERAVSLLRYHEYSEHILDDGDVTAVCMLDRCKPVHPSPSML